MAKLLIRYRWWLLGVAALIGVAAYFVSARLDFDRSIESMFASDDPVLHEYVEFKKNFEGNEIVLAVYDDPDLFNPDGSGIRKLSVIAGRLKQVSGVLDVLSLAEINKALEFIYLKQKQQPIVDPDDKLAREFLNIFDGYTHSADRETVSIVCLLDPSETARGHRQETIRELREIISQRSGIVDDEGSNNQLAGLEPGASGKPGQLTGEPVLVSDGFDFVERDGRLLGRTSIILLSVVIVLCFRSIRWVVIPITVVYWSLWVSRSIIVMVGIQMSMVSSMLSAIVTVIAVATVIHLIVRYREALADGKSRQESVQWALEILLVPIFWACVTDAAGFAALLFADTGPVRDFGLMMSVASLCVLLGIVMIVPGLSLLGRSIGFEPKLAWGEGNLKSALTASTGFMQGRARLIALSIALISIVISSGIYRLQVETDFTRNFKPGTQIVAAYEFVEQRMGGAGVIDIAIPAPKKLRMEYLEKVEALQDDLLKIKHASSNEPALNKVVSMADLDRAARQSSRALSVMSPEIRYRGMAGIMPTFAKTMRYESASESDQDLFRIMLRTSQRGSAEEHRELVRKIQATTKLHFPATADQPAPKTTGIFVLLSNLVSSLLADQTRTFTIATIGIFVVMLLALRSFKLALVAMLPNLLPILMLMGALGWVGARLNMGAVMIAAVSIGLSIDSSIHYLWAFQRWRSRGHSVFKSIQQSQHRVGRAAMFSTLALVAGFSTLCISEFVPTIYFGGLVSVSMLGGLFGNLIVLPISLILTHPAEESPIRTSSESDS